MFHHKPAVSLKCCFFFQTPCRVFDVSFSVTASFLSPVHVSQLCEGNGMLLNDANWPPFRTESLVGLSKSLLDLQWLPNPVSCLSGCWLWTCDPIWVVCYIFDFLMMDFILLKGIIHPSFGTILCAQRWCCLSRLLGYWTQSWIGCHSNTGYQQAGTHFADLGRITGKVNPTWY